MIPGDEGGARRRPVPGVAIAPSVLCAAMWMAGLAGCRQVASENDPVDTIFAASLTATMGRLEARFSQLGGRAVRGDPRGSVAGAHLIREGVWRPDAYITADIATVPLLGPYDPGWAVAFARSEVVLAYADGSAFKAALDSASRGELAWEDVVLRPGFRLGRTDPGLDPKGYRAIFAFRLVEEQGGRPGLAESLLSGPADAESVFPEEQLGTRLHMGNLDAGVFYLAEAKAQGLHTIRLPRLAGQGDPRDAGRLARMRYRAPDGRTFRGAPILYAATIPVNSRDTAAGTEFIAFLLSEEGRAILEADGFWPERMLLGDAKRIPGSLRALLER